MNFIYMIVKYVFTVDIHMKNIFQFWNFFMKCKQVVTNNKCSIEKQLIKPLFLMQGQAAW